MIEVSLANRQLTCATCGGMLGEDSEVTFEMIIDFTTRPVAVHVGCSVYGTKEARHARPHTQG